MSGRRAFDLSRSISELTRDSNLSGPRYLFSPESVPGLLITRIARPAPYLNMGSAWTLTRNYEDMFS